MKLSQESMASQELVTGFPTYHCLSSSVLISGSKYPFSSGSEQLRHRFFFFFFIIWPFKGNYLSEKPL